MFLAFLSSFFTILESNGHEWYVTKQICLSLSIISLNWKISQNLAFFLFQYFFYIMIIPCTSWWFDHASISYIFLGLTWGFLQRCVSLLSSFVLIFTCSTFYQQLLFIQIFSQVVCLKHLILNCNNKVFYLFFRLSQWFCSTYILKGFPKLTKQRCLINPCNMFSMDSTCVRFS